MKNSAKTKQIKVKPKLAAKATDQLELCRQAGEFHKAYLEVEFAAEEAYYEALQARIAELRSAPEMVVTTEEEEFETFDELGKGPFDE